MLKSIIFGIQNNIVETCNALRAFPRRVAVECDELEGNPKHSSRDSRDISRDVPI